MKHYTSVLILAVGLTLSACGPKPSTILKESESDSNTNTESASAKQQDASAENYADPETQERDFAASDTEHEPRVFVGELADSDFKYDINVEIRDNDAVFLILEVFDSETEENVALDTPLQVAHVHVDGCCQPAPPAVTELEGERTQIGALDIHGKGMHRVALAFSIDGSEFKISYDYEDK